MATSLSSLIQKKLFPTRHDRNVRSWYADGGDERFRFDYPLLQESVVIDLGGFNGQWTSDLYSRFRCKIHVFEPVKRFYDSISLRFKNNDDITVYGFGLGGSDRIDKIRLDSTSSSIINASGEGTEDVRIVDALRWFTEASIGPLDLVKINIEGAEYELLEHLLDGGFMTNVKNLQVQFHDVVPNAEERMQKIRRRLEKTHATTYCYDFVWENWQLR
ncbi:MAG TPA: FkbM family methyltransferase [Ensifer sp.]|nr:FkbM family methyltransferase [Ensifer sp.]